MCTEFGEKLQSAISAQQVNNFEWVEKDGTIIRMMDATPSQIKQWYKHCHEMLYNKDRWFPGKYEVKKNIASMWNSCNAELFIRYVLHDCESLKSKKEILELISTHRNYYEESILPKSISLLFNGLDPIYEQITISKLIDACFDKLEVLNKKMISSKFMLSQGIWLTQEEKADLTEVGMDGKIRPYMEVVKERLGLDPKIYLKVNPNGLSYTQFRALLQLPPLGKISALPTVTLQTLRDKVLYLLDNELNYHITKWTTLMNNVRQVASAKDIELPILDEK